MKGVPAFQMVPLKEDDDLIDRLLEENPDFRSYVKKCLRTKTVPAKQALAGLR
jgi:hypothetical protein